MPYAGANRAHSSKGKKMTRLMNYKRAKRLCIEINRDIAFFEAKFLKSRLHHI